MCSFSKVFIIIFPKGSIQERLGVLLSRTQNFFNEVTSPRAKKIRKQLDTENDSGFQVMEDIFMVEQTINRRMPYGRTLSLAAVICIEQFSRSVRSINAFASYIYIYICLLVYMPIRFRLIQELLFDFLKIRYAG